MKLIKFRIRNYKSIIDTGDCWLASDLTVLAGKNQSGKTAILEALRDCDKRTKRIPDSALPLEGTGGDPEIDLTLAVNNTILNNLANNAGITLSAPIRAKFSAEGITVTIDKDGACSLPEQLADILDKKIDEENSIYSEKIEQTVFELFSLDGFTDLEEFDLDDSISDIKSQIESLVSQATPIIETLSEDDKSIPRELLAKISEGSTKLSTEFPSVKLSDELFDYVPKFVFFADFDNILPFEIPFSEVDNHPSIADFAKVAGLDLPRVAQIVDLQTRRNILSKRSALLTGDFMGFWEQDKIELVAEPDGELLRLGVKESGNTTLFKPEQRSKGFQWFLSFYLRLKAESTDESIILIDEPGLYLHAKAQEDVLKILERISKTNQVIFSTHSPYLLDANRLDRIRLVQKSRKQGTKIENKIHKGADKDTLTPIITTIGLDLRTEFSIAGKNNVVLEGITDYYILLAMKELLKFNKCDLSLIPCVGAPKVPQIVSLLIGWGLDYVVVLDNDSEGRKVAKQLEEKLAIDHKLIVRVSKVDGHSIEDLFTRGDFNTLFLENEKNDEPEVSNSQFLKDSRLDKVLLAKKFFEKVRQKKSGIRITKETTDAFEKLFNSIAAGFEE